MKYRALVRVHIGGTDYHIDVGEIIEFDGAKITRAGGTVIELKTPSSIQAAINIGWLVPADSGITKVPPRASGVQVHAAQSTGPTRAPSKFATVSMDEQVVGGLNEVRGTNAPAAHQASNAAKMLSRAAPTGAVVAPTGMFDAPLSIGGKPSKGFQRGPVVQEGTGAQETIVPTRKFSTTAKGVAVQVGVNDGEALRAAQNATDRTHQRTQVNFDQQKLAEALPGSFSAPEEAPQGTATGDVDEMLAGDELEDILPGAATTGRPPAGVYKEGAIVGRGSGDQEFSTAEDGKVVGKIATAHAASVAPKADVDTMAAALAEITGEEIDLSSHSSEEVDLQAEREKARLDVVKHLVPEDFKWDMSPHWMARAKLAVDKYRDFPAILMAIMALEVPAVQAEIMKRMYPPKPAPAKAAIVRDETAVE